MNSTGTFRRWMLTLIAITTIGGNLADRASADPIVKLTGEGSLSFSIDGPASFVLSGNASHLGKYACYGEVDFEPGEQAGTWVGQGVAAIRAANGDLIVGVTTWQVDDAGNGQIGFSWRDSVEFSDGSVVSTTGRFIKARPAGAVSRLKTGQISDGTSNIIAILIG